MKVLRTKSLEISLLILVSLLTSFSLAALSLLNFPSFYQQNSQNRITTFLIISLAFFIFVLFTTKSLLLPYLKRYKKPSNLIFILIMMVFLTVTVAISSNYYWSVPVLHKVEICFDADDGSSSLIIRQLAHPVTNRLYPPDSFGSNRYPLLIDSGQCINGDITTYYRRIMRFWKTPGTTLVVQEGPPDGRLLINANEVPTVVYFNQDEENQTDNQYKITDGFDVGEKIEVPWNQSWFYGVKLLGIMISGIFLSLFFFGLTERMITFKPQKSYVNKQLILPFIKKRITFSKPPLHKILLALTILYFIVFGILMAHTSGQPDQNPHEYYSKRFSETWGIPEDDPNNSRVITGQPYLYYWLNGAVYKIYRGLFPDGQMRLALLWRLTSVVLSTFTVFYTYKLASKVTGNPYAGVLAAFFLSNTMMFVFISGGISYDNLMNLAGMAAIYHLVSLYKKEDFVRHTALTGIWVVVGALSKEQFLLMTLIIFLAWLFFTIRNLRNIQLNFTRKNIALIILLVIAIGLFVSLYGINLIRYGSTTPSCRQIKGDGRCGTYVYRQEFYNQFNLPGLWFSRDKFQNPINYAFDFWIMLMVQSIWGIFAHNTFIPKLGTALHAVLLMWSFICLVRYWKIKEAVSNVLIYILLAFVGYVFVWNYKLDVEYAFHHYGVTGRYLFPCIGALFALMAHYLSKIRPTFLKRLTITLAILINFFGGLGMFLSRYSEVFIHWRIYF